MTRPHELHVVAGHMTPEVGMVPDGDEGAEGRAWPAVRLLGPAGLLCDLINHLLRSAGVALYAGATAEDGRAVAVLVDPAPADWQAAGGAGLGIVLVVPEPLDDDDLLAAVLGGADAVVDADAGPTRLLQAIGVAAEANCLLGPDQARVVVAAARAACPMPPGPVKLTERERDIVASIERGESVKQTALALGITPKTVENLQGRLFRKLEVRNRAEAVSRCHCLGIVLPM